MEAVGFHSGIRVPLGAQAQGRRKSCQSRPGSPKKLWRAPLKTRRVAPLFMTLNQPYGPEPPRPEDIDPEGSGDRSRERLTRELAFRILLIVVGNVAYQLAFYGQVSFQLSQFRVPIGDGVFGYADVLFLSTYMLLVRPLLRLLHFVLKSFGLMKECYKDTFMQAFEPPLFWLGALFVWLVSFDISKTMCLYNTEYATLCSVLNPTLVPISVAAYVLVLANFVKNLLTRDIDTRSMNRRMRAEYALVEKAFTVASIVAMVGFSAYKIGVAPGTLLTYGSFSTLLLGFAAQHFLKDVASGFMIFLFKPFVVGDNVRLPSYKDAGLLKVVDIGWIYTEMRHWDSSPVILPNSSLYGNSIINRSLKEFAYFTEVVHIRYSDLPRMESLLESMTEYLCSRPEVASDSSTPLVIIEKLDSSFIDVRLMVWLVNVSTKRRMQISSAILLGLAMKINEFGCEFAFPRMEIASDLAPATSSGDPPSVSPSLSSASKTNGT
ncbi:hypothetical protein NDN08_006819 [Rhodosorus marinus]|uniref:Mechanosensitive ion channel MscS domain-containing protein n=1 Tax=Rhodosorus marinus TaxID=101924 RepID=A0AAV8UIZ7_9RHOD|nr:hypothetical protein NDN08_006819 [Rhodosorus marinus]